MAEFTCALCHETFEAEWSDDEALAEMHATLTPVPEWASAEDHQLEVICDDCYQPFITWAARAGLTLPKPVQETP